ncbi:Myc-type, basic helix-loop-helix (bHLH) domain [Dillenia turbinata]|uniref:Myc-type, basic helix-loop-helix (BHLH) domain n=1 Tax=Dillenia turbinata TaxID=194707 RepID=A0AAN8VRP5_9MAGN
MASNYEFGTDYFRMFDPFVHSFGGFNGVSNIGSGLSSSLVLDSEKSELVKAPVKLGKKGVSEAKALAALKSHSEAERRRRERINAHLDTLRGLVPCHEKMDKATLLAEVIKQVKVLEQDAIEASKGFLIPLDTNAVIVEPLDDIEEYGSCCFSASLCCEFSSDLLSDLRQAVDGLPVKMEKAEISTLGCRVKSVFILSGNGKGSAEDGEECQLLMNSVRRALTLVMEKASSPEYAPRTTLLSKRRRVSFFDSSSSSS